MKVIMSSRLDFLLIVAGHSFKLRLNSKMGQTVSIIITVFVSRFTRMVNCYTTWMVKTRTLPAGCVLFVARDTKENRIFSLFNITRKFTTERSMIFLLVQNSSFGMRTHTHSIWGYR